MNAVLGQLAIALGGLMFIVVLVLGLARGVPVLTAVFRATMVMCLSSLIIAMFFRFLSSILRRFVMEQMQEHSRAKAAKTAAGRRPVRPIPGMEEKNDV